MKDEEKVAMLATSVKIHSSNNIREKGKRGRQCTLAENKTALQEEKENDDLLNVPFAKAKLNRALRKGKLSAPDMDKIGCIINNLCEMSKNKLLELCNKVLEEGKIRKSWKEAVLMPTPKNGENCSNPGSFRPIALTSNICRVVEEMVNERLTCYVEKRGYVSKHQSEYRKGKQYGLVLRQIVKAQITKNMWWKYFLI